MDLIDKILEEREQVLANLVSAVRSLAHGVPPCGLMLSRHQQIATERTASSIQAPAVTPLGVDICEIHTLFRRTKSRFRLEMAPTLIYSLCQVDIDARSTPAPTAPSTNFRTRKMVCSTRFAILMDSSLPLSEIQMVACNVSSAHGAIRMSFCFMMKVLRTGTLLASSHP